MQTKQEVIDAIIARLQKPTLQNLAIAKAEIDWLYSRMRDQKNAS